MQDNFSSKKEISLAEGVDLLVSLIRIPSISREEAAAADFLQGWLSAHGLTPFRVGNNLWCCDEAQVGPDGKAFLPECDRPTLLLNAHIDTVKPAQGYTRDPFTPSLEGDFLYGLGSNDDGGSLVALTLAYSRLRLKDQPYRLVLSLTAQEEISGREGIEALFPFLGKIDLGIMGEPTGMRMAVAERGLMVLDCTAHGKSGHAARNEGDNALYHALDDISWFRNTVLERVSEHLGPVKMTVTQISAGTQHNVIPAECSFVVDVRPNGLYTNLELLSLIKSSVKCDVKERSTRLGSSSIPMDHPVVKRGLALGLEAFGSPTTSNQAVSPFTTLKIGPGDSSRSHTADEYIRISEMEDGVGKYISLLDGLSI